MKLEISNETELDTWINIRRRSGVDIFAIKGPAPEGATYDDGDIISRPVNIAWQDGVTGETFYIKYK